MAYKTIEQGKDFMLELGIEKEDIQTSRMHQEEYHIQMDFDNIPIFLDRLRKESFKLKYMWTDSYSAALVVWNNYNRLPTSALCRVFHITKAFDLSIKYGREITPPVDCVVWRQLSAWRDSILANYKELQAKLGNDKILIIESTPITAIHTLQYRHILRDVEKSTDIAHLRKHLAFLMKIQDVSELKPLKVFDHSVLFAMVPEHNKYGHILCMCSGKTEVFYAGLDDGGNWYIDATGKIASTINIALIDQMKSKA